MRTIKFRGKRLYDGEWVYGCPLVVDTDKRKVAMIVTLHEAYPDTLAKVTTSVDFNSLGQFTGLYDKNGKEIYEGDILLWTRKNVHIEGRQLQDLLHKCVVYYDNDKCAFQFRCKLRCGACVGYLDFDDDRADESFVEVVGNIHDNPSLIKKGD